MSDVINMHKAKSTLSQLVVRALEGEEIIIGRAGQPMVKLVALEPQNNVDEPVIAPSAAEITPTTLHPVPEPAPIAVTPEAEIPNLPEPAPTSPVMPASPVASPVAPAASSPVLTASTPQQKWLADDDNDFEVQRLIGIE